ncbi:MAG: hypothetical protein A2048_04045 [Deltaproteobacteria bacterium GWA2_45_12]|nr:MAG: hypothetical protein A2048_04045 [Deltaproteobacteria bacterium GWA2_45_12]
MRDKGEEFAIDKHPAVYVSHYGSLAYSLWLNQQTIAERARLGLGVFRLPTEAEWEGAARGPEGTFEWGTSTGELSHELAHYDAEATAPVGSKPGILYGAATLSGIPEELKPYLDEKLFDMAGNVWEWTADWYGAYEMVRNGKVLEYPTGPVLGQWRVLRGGSLYSVDPGVLRAAFRNLDLPDYRGNDFGFRLAVSPGTP